MEIRIATTDPERAGCFPVMRELRPHLDEAGFVDRVRRQEQGGYRLAFVAARPGVVAVAGFRVGENLAWGRFLYVDDLVTASRHRSRGYGAALLAWLRERAAAEGCAQLHLDSGLQREAAHRFYAREGLQKTSFHFAEPVPHHVETLHPPESEPVVSS